MSGKAIRGMVVDVNLDPTIGSKQGRRRPCIVVQNDVGNKYSPVTIVVPLTDAANIKKPIPSIHVLIRKGEAGLTLDSYALANHIRTIDQTRLEAVHGHLTPATIQKIDQALKNSLALC
jgi:mRNA interferase MazF